MPARSSRARLDADRRQFRLDLEPARGPGRGDRRADLAVGADAAAAGRPHARQTVPGRKMRLAVLRRHQEQEPPLVRDGGLRQPGQAEALRPGARAMRLAFVAALAMLALASCARELETDQARLCRMALPALSPRDADGLILERARGRRRARRRGRFCAKPRRAAASGALPLQIPGPPVALQRARVASRSTARRSAKRASISSFGSGWRRPRRARPIPRRSAASRICRKSRRASLTPCSRRSTPCLRRRFTRCSPPPIR